MAGNDQGQRIGSARSADRTGSPWLSKLSGHPTIGSNAAIGNGLERPPHLQPEAGRIRKIKRQAQSLGVTGKIAKQGRLCNLQMAPRFDIRWASCVAQLFFDGSPASFR
jgi:hypothetical protein